jgi:hypothetical protein
METANGLPSSSGCMLAAAIDDDRRTGLGQTADNRKANSGR